MKRLGVSEHDGKDSEQNGEQRYYFRKKRVDGVSILLAMNPAPYIAVVLRSHIDYASLKSFFPSAPRQLVTQTRPWRCAHGLQEGLHWNGLCGVLPSESLRRRLATSTLSREAE